MTPVPPKNIVHVTRQALTRFLIHPAWRLFYSHEYNQKEL